MKIVCLLILFNGYFISLDAQDTWVPRDSVNGPGKSACTAFAIGLKGYIGFGVADDGYKRSLYEYDPIEDDWDKMESLGGLSGGGLERVSPVSFVIGEKAYVGLGNGNTPYYKDIWQYDPATNTWTQKADFGGTARRQAVAFAIDSLAYVGTGLDANGYCADFWRYSPASNSWSSIADFGGGVRKQAVGFSMGNKGYVGTGDDGGFSNDFWQYDPVNNSWTQKTDFPGLPRYAATAVAAYPDAIVGLGYDNSLNYASDLYRYDANTDTWVQLADFPGGARSNAVGFVIQRHVYIGCGYSSSGAYLDDFYEYDNLIHSPRLVSSSDMKVQLYPQPLQSAGFVEIQSKIPAVLLELRIFSSDGKEVTNRFDCQNTDKGWYLNAGNNPDGLYIYTISLNKAPLASGQLTIIR